MIRVCAHACLCECMCGCVRVFVCTCVSTYEHVSACRCFPEKLVWSSIDQVCKEVDCIVL